MRIITSFAMTVHLPRFGIASLLLSLTALVMACSPSGNGAQPTTGSATGTGSPGPGTVSAVTTPSPATGGTVGVDATSTTTPTASPTQTSPSQADPIIGVIPAPPERDLYDLARRITLSTTEPVDRFASPPPPKLNVGDRFQWRVSRDEGNVTVDAEVMLISENAYWVFADGTVPEQGRLQRAASDFETLIWPTVTGTFGDVWTPGVDNDPRIVIFHTRLRAGVAGYFSGIDEYPVQIQPESNQREVIYISSDGLALGGTGYLGTIAHELQHAIHWAADPGEESWINEGVSELAARLAGFPPNSPNAFLQNPGTSLVQWQPEIFQASPNYGAAALFIEYLFNHYGGDDIVRAIVEHPLDGIESIDAALQEAGFNLTMADVFADWVVTNYVDDSTGVFSYPNRVTPRPMTLFVPTPNTLTGSVLPFGTDYYTLQDVGEEVTIEFSGEPTGRVFPAEPHSGNTCWWTNAGDSIDSTLTRPVDLRNTQDATFEFWTWYSIEEDWDYAYVLASTDDGVTWEILPTDLSSHDNPNGTSFGPGITGESNGWVKDSADLSRFAGSEILLRLEYITDDAIHSRGACFDDFSIPEISWNDSAEYPGEWATDGFALINDERPVEYLVQVIRHTNAGLSTVERMTTGENGEAKMRVPGPAQDEQIVVAVSLITAEVAGDLDYSIRIPE